MNRLNLSIAADVMRWLVWDTFRQAVSARIFAVMTAVSIVAIVFCAGVRVRGGVERPSSEPTELLPRGEPIEPENLERTGVQVIHGELSLAFGLVRLDHARDATDSVSTIQLILAGGVAGTLGVLLTLIGTAGFLPAFLEPANASVLLTKPVPRWLLILGKYLGILVFVGFQASIFVGGTWIALGAATGVWAPRYLLAVPLLVFQFAFFYSFSVLLAVITRSTVVCAVGSVLFWGVCLMINSARVEHLSNPEATPMSRAAVSLGYWVLPKPVDFGMILGEALEAGHRFASWPALKEYSQHDRGALELSLLTSLFVAGGMVTLAARIVGRVDY